MWRMSSWAVFPRLWPLMLAMLRKVPDSSWSSGTAQCRVTFRSCWSIIPKSLLSIRHPSPPPCLNRWMFHGITRFCSPIWRTASSTATSSPSCPGCRKGRSRLEPALWLSDVWKDASHISAICWECCKNTLDFLWRL